MSGFYKCRSDLFLMLCGEMNEPTGEFIGARLGRLEQQRIDDGFHHALRLIWSRHGPSEANESFGTLSWRLRESASDKFRRSCDLPHTIKHTSNIRFDSACSETGFVALKPVQQYEDTIVLCSPPTRARQAPRPVGTCRPLRFSPSRFQ